MLKDKGTFLIKITYYGYPLSSANDKKKGSSIEHALKYMFYHTTGPNRLSNWGYIFSNKSSA